MVANDTGAKSGTMGNGSATQRLEHAPLSADAMLQIVQTLPDVIFQCEKRADGKIYWTLNEGRLAEEFHVTTREIEGKSLEELFPGGASDALVDHFERAFGGETNEFVNEIGGRYFKHHPQPVFNDDGRVIHVVGFITEVTNETRAQMEIQKLTEELAKRLIDLSHANRDLETFNYTLSHDLRSPLTVIQTQCALITRTAKEGKTDRIADRANKVQDAARRMSELMESVLSLADASRHGIARQDVDLSAFAVQVLDDLQETEPERSIDVDVVPDLHVWGDAKLLHQVIENLLGNAWKYTARSEGPSIRFGERWDHGERIFFVQDTGTGFDMAYAGWLFEPFKRLHEGTEFSGTGVGLATVRKIISRHGGRIWAEGKPGEGATFYFTIPESGPTDRDDDGLQGGA